MTASFPTYLLTRWTRTTAAAADSRSRSWSAPVAAAALSVGLPIAGMLAPGFKADVNVVDSSQLRLHPRRYTSSLPVSRPPACSRAVGGYEPPSSRRVRRAARRRRADGGRADGARKVAEPVRRGGGFARARRHSLGVSLRTQTRDHLR